MAMIGNLKNIRSGDWVYSDCLVKKVAGRKVYAKLYLKAIFLIDQFSVVIIAVRPLFSKRMI
jgi:hypothetical protein